jgi:hypothetical protein
MYGARGCTVQTLPEVGDEAVIFRSTALPARIAIERARLGKVHSLQATSDKGGEHPASTEISGPATVTCLNGVSETPNTQVSCSVTGPGLSGVLNKGKSANLTGAGTVTLKCHGQGFMRCDARVDLPPPAK